MVYLQSVIVEFCFGDGMVNFCWLFKQITAFFETPELMVIFVHLQENIL